MSVVVKIDEDVRARWLGVLLVLCVVTAVFSPVYDFSFLNFDDDAYVTENPHVLTGLTRENIVWAFTDARVGHWHPLTWLSHMLDAEIFGLSSAVSHFENVLLHAASAALLFIISTILFGSWRCALFIALLFGIHPMRIESVAWASERKDVLSMFFGLFTILVYFWYREKKGMIRYLALTASFILAILAKPTMVVLPCLLILIDMWLARRILSDCSQRLLQASLIIEKIPLFILSICSVLITITTQHDEGAVVGLKALSVADRVANMFVGYLAYSGKFLFPFGLGIFYPLTAYPPGVGVGACIGFISLSWIFLRKFKMHPTLALGWVWFVITPIPIIGIVQFGGQAFADRWSYLPHIGLLLGVVAWLRDTITALRPPQWCVWSSAIATIIFYGSITVTQLPYWRDSISLFQHTLEVAPHNFMAHTNLGSALDVAGRLDEAALHYEEAYRLNPTYPEAINNLGTLRARQGRLDEGIELFRKALAIRSNFPAAAANLELALRSK